LSLCAISVPCVSAVGKGNQSCPSNLTFSLSVVVPAAMLPPSAPRSSVSGRLLRIECLRRSEGRAAPRRHLPERRLHSVQGAAAYLAPVRGSRPQLCRSGHLSVGAPIIDVARMIARKNGIVKQLTSGIKGLFKKNKVTLLNGHGSFRWPQGVGESEVWQVKVGDELVEAKQVIVATGSKARHLPGIPVDNEIVCDNVGALDIDAVPKKLAVIGAGVIGLEMGSVWRRLGAEVTILEAAAGLSRWPTSMSPRKPPRRFRQAGLKIITGIEIGEVKVSQKGVSIDYTRQGRQRAEARRRPPDRLDRPHSEHRWPGAEAVGLKITSAVSDRSRCALPHQSARRVGGRRRGAGPDAGAQGDGRGRHGGRDDGWPGRALQSSTPCPGSSTPARKSPGSARPSSS
jgi:hypothetical protein